jgi:hypothetical protein
MGRQRVLVASGSLLMLVAACGAAPRAELDGEPAPEAAGAPEVAAAPAQLSPTATPPQAPEAVAPQAEPGGVPATPAAVAACVAFHAKLRECGESEPGLDADRGCAGIDTGPGNPVSAHVAGLWRRCAPLPCAEVARCFEAGLVELAAPPGSY